VARWGALFLCCRLKIFVELETFVLLSSSSSETCHNNRKKVLDMIQIRASLKTVLLSSLAFSTTLLVACGDPANPTGPGSPGNPGPASLSAIAVSEISSDSAVSANISLSWGALGSQVSSIKIFRRPADQGTGNATEISTFPNSSRLTLDDTDPSLVPGVDYIYSLRGDNQENIAVASASSQPIKIIDAAAIPAFALTQPAQNGVTLQDVDGQGHTFTWADAGTGLYHVQVSDTAGVVRWGAITKNTSISYGTRSGAERRSGVTTQPDPKLMVPMALTNKLTVSSTAPNIARNEVQFQGIGQTGQYRIQVSAIETQPNKGDLAGANSIAIRKAQEVRFIAQ